MSQPSTAPAPMSHPRPERSASHRAATEADAPEHLLRDYEAVRRFTHQLTDPLPAEDQVVQSIESVSPTKWHLAHTSWFFERFILHALVPDYRPYHETYYYLFNSYYNGAGPQHCRASRGLISRPTVAEVHAYRRYIDERMTELITHADGQTLETLRPLVVLGLHHEQQHQELIVTDIKHIYSSNPLLPSYPAATAPSHNARSEQSEERDSNPTALHWLTFDAGLYEIGHAGDGFHFDNETPRHRVYLHDFAIAGRPVTNGEYLAFIEDGGYDRHELWLSMGYDTIQREGWRMPIYWYRDGETWMQYTLAGPRPLAPDEPVSHLSYFEADAFARWAGHRLPREAEWEVAAQHEPVEGNFAESMRFHPAPLRERTSEQRRLQRCFGDVWEWTQSQYEPYPGYRPLEGTLGEYNGKFMCNQFVLRGGSCATAQSHIRPTYRNFFAPEARWQLTGLRLARDR